MTVALQILKHYEDVKGKWDIQISLGEQIVTFSTRAGHPVHIGFFNERQLRENTERKRDSFDLTPYFNIEKGYSRNTPIVEIAPLPEQIVIFGRQVPLEK